MPHIIDHVRFLRALNMRRRSRTLSDIGVEFGVSVERARQMVRRGLELERQMTSTDPWDELSVRTRNALVNDGCEPTLDGVVARYRVARDLKPVLAFGAVCLAELQAWLVRHGRARLG